MRGMLFWRGLIDTYIIWAITFCQFWPFRIDNLHTIGDWPPIYRLIGTGVIILSQIGNELIVTRLARE